MFTANGLVPTVAKNRNEVYPSCNFLCKASGLIAKGSSLDIRQWLFNYPLTSQVPFQGRQGHGTPFDQCSIAFRPQTGTLICIVVFCDVLATGQRLDKACLGLRTHSKTGDAFLDRRVDTSFGVDLRVPRALNSHMTAVRFHAKPRLRR